MKRNRFAAALTVVALLCGTGLRAGISDAGTAARDTSYAVENSYACLGGGCHEGDAKLVADYAASSMTHYMVKCNACHGTHTVGEVGLAKPNLTGYKSGMGATGYVVGRDRCLVCHMEAVAAGGHPKNPGECLGCHGPHRFRARQ